MHLQFVDCPEYPMDLDSVFLRYSPQRVVACQQDAVFDFLRQSQRKAVVERETCMPIIVPGCTLEEPIGQDTHIKAQVSERLFFILSETKPFVFKKRMRHDKTVGELQQGIQEPGFSQIDHAACVANDCPRHPWQVLSVLVRRLPKAFATAHRPCFSE